MSYPTVSVIIPTYNRAHLVSRAIQSVLTQTFTDFELIIVDDASSDETPTVITKFKDPRIRYTALHKNSGLSIARNSGITVAQGTYIAFLDDDDEWLPEKLSKQVQAFEKGDAQVGACYTWIKSVHESKQREQIITPTYEGYIFENLLYSCFANVSSLMVKSECFQRLGMFDSRFRGCEDWDFSLRIAREYKFVVVPEVLSIYWNHDSSNRLTNKYSFMLDAYLNLLSKHPEIQELPHRFREVGTDSLNRKSEYFFERGKRYMNWGLISFHSEGVKLAKAYLKAAFFANPRKISTFTHYIFSSYFEDQYLSFTKLEKTLRRQKYSLTQRARQCFKTL